jgi:hypothetical protein
VGRVDVRVLLTDGGRQERICLTVQSVGLARPFGGAREANHIQLAGG